MKWLFTGIAIGLAFSWVRISPDFRASLEDSISHSASQAEPAPVAVPDPVVAPEQHPAAVAEPETPQETQPAAADDANLVEFRIVDGLAIAFGDVIIGRRSKGSALVRGWHPLPETKLWPTPVIPFHIAPELPDPQRVRLALALLQSVTVLKFVPYEGEGDGVAFEPGPEHCLATLGRQGGLQPVMLAPGCGQGEIVHEILHVLGFIHEQSRTDRDRHVEILWENIDEQYAGQFALVPEALMAPVRDSAFDFRSIMLYRPDTFARGPGLSTMRARDRNQAIAPMTDGLSIEDIRKVNRLFGR
jgi:hypothetical protein